MRLDIYLVEQGWYETRSKAKSAILRNVIIVNNKVINKPNYQTKDSDKIIKKDIEEYVSRGSHKLIAAINNWNIDFKDKIILDVGSSTGGFTDASLKFGAKIVYAVDVGTNQLHKSLKTSFKVISFEKTHFKDIEQSMFNDKIDIVLADISFISLTKLINKLVQIFDYEYKCVFLIKPEYELSPKEINRGKVIGQRLLTKAVDKIKKCAIDNHFKIHGVIESPIKGNKAGNTEFLIYMDKR